MKILVTNHDLSQYGGTQSWVLEAVRVLSKAHTVDVFAYVAGGEVFDHIRTYTRDTYIGKTPGRDYDLLLVNHNTCMQMAEFLPGIKIYTQHGPTHQAEEYWGGADACVAVSPEVADAMQVRGHAPSIIGNGIDLGRFTPSVRPATDRPTVLSLCKGLRGQEAVQAACKQLGWTCDSIHYKTNGTLAIEGAIRAADLVIGYGRCILEAMACGRPAFVFDARGREDLRGDGWVTDTNIEQLARVNFSGRHMGLIDDVETLTATLKDGWPSPQTTDALRGWVENHADADQQFAQYLTLKELLHGTYELA